MKIAYKSASISLLFGKQVMQKAIGGNTGFTQVAIPVLSKETYLMTFYCNGWQSAEKFVVGG